MYLYLLKYIVEIEIKKVKSITRIKIMKTEK